MLIWLFCLVLCNCNSLKYNCLIGLWFFFWLVWVWIIWEYWFFLISILVILLRLWIGMKKLRYFGWIFICSFIFSKIMNGYWKIISWIVLCGLWILWNSLMILFLFCEIMVFGIFFMIWIFIFLIRFLSRVCDKSVFVLCRYCWIVINWNFWLLIILLRILIF